MIFIAGVVVLAILLVNYCLYLDRRRARGLPPGPPLLPIIGNLHLAPTSKPWNQYNQWFKEYGPIYRLIYGQQTVVMLGDYETARRLFDKRSNIYSSRPRLPMVFECVAKEMHPVFMPYGNRFRTHQRLQGSYLNPRSSESYTEIQELESKQLIFELLSSNDFHYHFYRFNNSVMNTLAYGKRCPLGDEPELKATDQIMRNLVDAARVGAWIVDAIPQLNVLPKMLAPWKRHADKAYNFEAAAHTRNFKNAEKTSAWNWCKQVSSKAESQLLSRLELNYSVGNTYIAGSDTTSITLDYCVLAAVLHPAIVKKAQAELDTVVGSSRLPTFADKDRLPYIAAFVKEVLRWRPLLLCGMPHATTEEDEYMGYRIPKGAVVMAIAWSISQDESIFPNPEEFNPDRWIENPELSLGCAWGWGRRACPGRYIAYNSLFIIMAQLLWAFDVERTYEVVNGVKVEVKINSLARTDGLSNAPEPFEVNFKVRSEKAEEVVRREWDEAEKDVDVILERVGRAQADSKGRA
ncbi:putative cytochrome P450 oxidoreductase [Stipitochalara longipes BDJ]|nr:putative cytochrome P450 oxidoreductase [Stipitochalara longipes BDJ]